MPNPPVLEPDSTMEHYACVLFFITVVLVIGSALSIVTGTLNEIRQVSSENSRRRRQLRIYLQTKGVPTGMTMRVMSYADYKLGWHSQLNFDNSLVSPRLEKELAFLQLGGQLQQHPVFDLAAQVFPEVFKEICRDLERMFFCEAEFVFSAGAFAENMYLTCTGKFAVNISNNNASPYVFADEFRYFAEVALYVEAAMHGYSLQTFIRRCVCPVKQKPLHDPDKFTYVRNNVCRICHGVRGHTQLGGRRWLRRRHLGARGHLCRARLPRQLLLPRALRGWPQGLKEPGFVLPPGRLGDEVIQRPDLER